MKIVEEFLREIKSFGMAKVSRLSGVPLSTISSWFVRDSVPTLDIAQKVADAMGLEFLLFDKE